MSTEPEPEDPAPIQIVTTKVLEDFDWTTKLVVDSDTSVEAAKLLVQLCFHFSDRSPTAVYEFTADELERFIADLEKVRPRQ